MSTIQSPLCCYLFTLEVESLQMGEIYDELPLHCTLAHRFWIKLNPEELTDGVSGLFNMTPPLALTAYKRTLLGSKQIPVSLVEHTVDLLSLNMQLYDLLNERGAIHTAPEWSGERHILHVTERTDKRLTIGESHLSTAIYLIEVKVPGHEQQRIIRNKFELIA